MAIQRSISWTTRFSLLFGRVIYQVGWGFLLIGVVLSIIVSTMLDWSFLHTAGSTVEAVGKVTSVSPTNAKINKTTVYSIDYTFTLPSGKAVTGTSYADGMQFTTGESVSIRYPEGRPEKSSIVGTRRNKFPADIMFVYLFPLAGAVVAYFCLRNYAHSMNLLASGVLTHGRLISKKKTWVRENRRPIYRLTFEFSDDQGRTHLVSATSSSPASMEDEERERILYDPQNPDKALVVDSISGKTTIDDTAVQTKLRGA